jgi:hypothetical protein
MFEKFTDRTRRIVVLARIEPRLTETGGDQPDG